MNKISICMSYYNRYNLLKNTLKSISEKTIPDEIIIVDDASSKEPLTKDNIQEISCGMNIVVYRFNPANKTWINPCIAFNKAFSLSSKDSDVIIIQNPECLHRDDIVGYCRKADFANNYCAFGCYSLPKGANHFSHILQNRKNSFDGDDAWYQHSIYRPENFHFTSAISRKSLFELGGFDENYSDGMAYDDNEFVFRIKQKLNIISIDDQIVFHQYHERKDTPDRWLKELLNMKKFESLKSGTYFDFQTSLRNDK